MKLSYEKQGVADADDALLQRAKKFGKVPDGCLLGGNLVQFLLENDTDPCSVCGINRNLCQGRSPKDPAKVLHLHKASESEAKAFDRLRQIVQLDKILHT